MQTITIDEILLAQAMQKTGVSDPGFLVEAGVRLLISLAGKQPEFLELLEDLEDIRDAEAILARHEPSISLEEIRKELGLAH